MAEIHSRHHLVSRIRFRLIASNPNGEVSRDLSVEVRPPLDPTASDSFHPDFAKNGGMLDFTYIRRKTSPGEAEFQVEWSDNLNHTWSTSGVTETQLSQTPETETMEAVMPAGVGRRFVRLSVRRP